MILSLCLPFGVLAENDVPTYTVDFVSSAKTELRSKHTEEYIKEWLVLGPFFPDNLATDFLSDAGSEANIHPKEGDAFTTADRKTLAWKRYSSTTDTVELVKAIGDHESATGYAACTIISLKAQTLEAVLKSNDSVKVWLNGKQIHANLTTRGGDIDRFPVVLEAGSNECLIKVARVDTGGAWNFTMRIVDEQGYLQSLGLELAVRRRKPDEFKDVLSMTARRAPQSTLWTPPSVPVQLEIRDEASQLLTTLQSRTGQSVDWTVPDDVQGTLKILAQHTDASRKTHEAKFTCQAHSTVPVTPRMGHWKTIDVTDGLGGYSIMSIVQDRNGSLWFGLLEGGVCRYDGRTFRTFTTQDGLPSNNIWTVFEDSRGNLWFGTMDYWTKEGAGVCKYDGVTFQTFTTKDGLASDAVTAIYEDDSGHLWFGTTKGVSKFDGMAFRNYTAEKGFPSDWVEAITKDKEGNLWFGHGLKGTIGKGTGATRYDGSSFTRFTTQDGLVNNSVKSITTDVQGNLWFTTEGGVSKYDGKTFQNYTTAEGMANNWVDDIIQTKNGDLWFATWGGVSQYDGTAFQNFTTKDGLAHNWVNCITEDREGNLWFGTWNSGVSRYDRSVKSIPVDMSISFPMRDTKGNLWFGASGVGLIRYNGRSLQAFAIEDGFLYDHIQGVFEDSRGNIWIGTYRLVKYDGEQFQTFTHEDGLPDGYVWVIREDKNGVLWLGTEGGGVCTYDGKKFVHVAGKKELGDGWGWVSYIIEDQDGNMWFSLPGHGLCRQDGKTFTRFTTENGLPGNTSWGFLQDRKGNIWIATEGGLCRYDGTTFQTFTKKDGLTGNVIARVFEDSRGNLWFGMGAGGVHKFDGENFQQFTIDDGLLSNTFFGIQEDEAGKMIFFTSKGITIYTPPKKKIPPPVSVIKVVADKVYPAPVGLTHTSPLKIPSTAKHISFTYYGMSFKTKQMRYNYMLEGYDKDWQATWDEQVSYEDLKPGDYTFKVIAINRDLVYSETPATVHLKIITPFYLRASLLAPTIGFGVILIAALTILSLGYLNRRRQVQAYQQAAVEELQDANRVQMMLMPDKAPPIEGLEIAGKCLPANTVSGDFFDYLVGKGDNQIGLVVADVCGKAMKGAMNAMMTDGILHSVAKDMEKLAPASLMIGLNEVLKGRLEQYMNVTMVIGVVDADAKNLTFANAAHHAHPLLRRDSEIHTLKAGGLPLGMRAGAEYTEEQFPLHSGDVLVLMTDGIIEAEDSEGSMYSDSGRLDGTIKQFTLEQSAESMVDAIINDAIDFGGDKAQRGDDMTVVVAKIQGGNGNPSQE